jgi:hypothetical protein
VAATSEDHSIRSLQAELAKVKKDEAEESQASAEEVKRLREVLRKRDVAWKEAQISTQKAIDRQIRRVQRDLDRKRRSTSPSNTMRQLKL